MSNTNGNSENGRRAIMLDGNTAALRRHLAEQDAREARWHRAEELTQECEDTVRDSLMTLEGGAALIELALDTPLADLLDAEQVKLLLWGDPAARNLILNLWLSRLAESFLESDAGRRMVQAEIDSALEYEEGGEEG